MRLYGVYDLPERDLLEGLSYDLVMYASGIEARATTIARRYQNILASEAIVVGFPDLLDDVQRLENDAFFGSIGATPVAAVAADASAIMSLLHDREDTLPRAARVFVDISSMSRLWYAAILNWARHLSDGRSVVVDVGYAVGRPSLANTVAAIRSIEAVPGFEATVVRDRSVVIMGLGFDEWAPSAVLDLMEPDEVIAFIAKPSVNARYPQQVQRIHKRFIARDVTAQRLVELPLLSVEQSFRLLSELAQSYGETAKVTIVPMGPKPHVLASFLVASRFDFVGCLRVSRMARLGRAEPTGDVSLTRVVFA